MPIKSKKQWGLMQVAAHNPGKLKMGGPSPEVAKKFISETPSKKRKMFAKG